MCVCVCVLAMLRLGYTIQFGKEEQDGMREAVQFIVVLLGAASSTPSQHAWYLLAPFK